MEASSKRSRIPWLVIIVAAVVLLVAGGAVAALFVLRNTEAQHYRAASNAYAEGQWDKAIEAYPLRIEEGNVEIVPVDRMFAE